MFLMDIGFILFGFGDATTFSVGYSFLYGESRTNLQAKQDHLINCQVPRSGCRCSGALRFGRGGSRSIGGAPVWGTKSCLCTLSLSSWESLRRKGMPRLLLRTLTRLPSDFSLQAFAGSCGRISALTVVMAVYYNLLPADLCFVLQAIVMTSGQWSQPAPWNPPQHLF